MSSLVRKWALNLPMMVNDIKSMAVWIKFFGIPLKFQTLKGLRCLASVVGKPLYMDSITNEGIHLEYARICVEIAVDSSYPDSIDIQLLNGDKIVIRLECNWKQFECSKYNCFGLAIGEYVIMAKEDIMSNHLI